MDQKTLDYRSGNGSQPPPGDEFALRGNAFPPPLMDEPHKSRFGWLVALICVLVLAAAIYFVVTHAKGTAAPAANGKFDQSNRVIPVVVAQATVGDVPVYLQNELGYATPLATVTIKTQVDGKLIKVAFQEGQMVKQGDLLAQVDPRPYQALLESAQGQLARDQATLTNDRLDLKRYTDQNQQEPGSVTDQQVATQQALVDQYVGIVKSDQGQVDSAQVNLDYCKITAPISGRIGLRNVDEGNIVHATDTAGLAVMTQENFVDGQWSQPIAVTFSINSSDISRVLGKASTVPPLVVEARSLSDDKKTIATGKLQSIDSQIDQTTSKVRLKAIFENKDNLLFPNQFMHVWVLVDTLHDVVLVPEPAIQSGPDNLVFVYVVKSDVQGSTVEVRKVTVDPDSPNDPKVITAGLAKGETVVVDGVDKLQPSSKVTISQPDGSPPTTGPGSSTQPGRGGRRGGGRRGGAGGNPTDTSAVAPALGASPSAPAAQDTGDSRGVAGAGNSP